VLEPGKAKVMLTNISKPETPEVSEVLLLFHQCWGQAQESPEYDKAKWSLLDIRLHALLRR